MQSTRAATVLAAILLTLPLAAHSAEITDPLHAKAAAEGEVDLYGQGPPQAYADWAKEFEAKYPGVHVRITGGRYELATKIDAQIKAGKMEADLAILQTVSDFVRWRQAHALARYAPPGFGVIPASFKDGKAQFLPVMLAVVGFGYNPAAIVPAAAPHAITDFLKPEFKDKIVSTYPHDDDITLYEYSQIVGKYGWGFVSKLMAQHPKFVRSHVLVAGETAGTDHPVTFDEMLAFNKVTYVVPGDVPLTVVPITGGIFAKAPHPNAARLFLNFLLSPEQQGRMAAVGNWSARPDVAPPPGFKPLAQYHIAANYVAFVSDPARLEKLRARFEHLIGPADGAYVSTLPPAK